MDENINTQTGLIVDAAMRVHSALGPGLLENAYCACLTHELLLRGVHVVPQSALPLEYHGIKLDVGYRIDLLVERKIVVEVKAVNKLVPLHHAQLFSYLRLGNFPVGLLMNFHVSHLKDGIHRIINKNRNKTQPRTVDDARIASHRQSSARLRDPLR